MKPYDIVGIGNALCDINVEASDVFLRSYDLIQGTMLLTEVEMIEEMYQRLPTAHNIQPGGSCGNSIAVLANLGGKVAFIGKVSDDERGTLYRKSLEELGIKFLCDPHNHGMSGSCLVLVSPDAQRTMVTALGISADLNADDIDEDLIKHTKALYLEGYLYDKDSAKSAFDKAATIVRNQGGEISLSLSDLFCVERHLKDFQNFVENYCSILFANEQEFSVLYNISNRDDAIKKAKSLNKIICLTLASEGACVIKGDESYLIPAYDVGKVIDTTGAGDSFAGGFLYGIHHKLSLEQSGHLASLLAGDVTTHYGPRSLANMRELITKKLSFTVP